MNKLRIIKFGFDSTYSLHANKVHDAIYRFSFSGYREGVYIKRHINTRKYGIEINRYDNK
jgi:hypothetical protein